MRRKLFNGGNPSRKEWEIAAAPDHLSILYHLETGPLEVAFWPEREKQSDQASRKIILSSNETRFGSMTGAAAPETIVSG